MTAYRTTMTTHEGALTLTLDWTPAGPRCTVHVHDTLELDEPVDAMASLDAKQLEHLTKLLAGLLRHMHEMERE